MDNELGSLPNDPVDLELLKRQFLDDCLLQTKYPINDIERFALEADENRTWLFPVLRCWLLVNNYSTALTLDYYDRKECVATRRGGLDFEDYWAFKFA